LFHRDQLAAELAEEMRYHRERLAEEVARQGVGEAEAMRRAAVRLGNATVLRERSREWWSLGWMEAPVQDVRYAIRFLRRSPGFTAVAVLSLALGIGANAAVFTLVDRLMLRPPAHVRDPGRVLHVNVRRRFTASGTTRPVTHAMPFGDVYALREQARGFQVVPFTDPARVRAGRGPDAPRIKESRVAGDYFGVLGLWPLLGRWFLPDDDRSGAPLTAVISYAYWQRTYGASPSAVGSRITLSDLEFEIIGVAPRGFGGVTSDAADVWVPMEAVNDVRHRKGWKDRRGFAARGFVRLRDGVSVQQADAEATMILRRLEDAPGYAATETVVHGSILPARGPAEQTAEVKVSTRLAMGALLVLLAACANVAGLLLLRALTRRREIALRLAIGVSRGRLIAQLLLESLVLALAGAAAALLVARWGGQALRGLVFPQATWVDGPVDSRVAFFAFLCALLVAMFAGLTPAVRMTRADVAASLRSAGAQLTRSTGKLRQGLMVLQVALSVVLVVGATVFAQSLTRARAVDMGVDVERLVMTRLFLHSDTQSTAGREAMFEEAKRRATLLPGVERVALAEAIPLTGYSVRPVFVPGRDSLADPSAGHAVTWNVTPELIATAGYRLVRGRWILPADVRGSEPVVLVTQAMARRLWPGGEALGRCVRLGGVEDPCRIVVGIVGDLRSRSVREEPPMAALLPVAQADLDAAASSYLVVRTGGKPRAMVAALRQAMRDVHPDVATMEIQPLAQALEFDYRPLRLGATMFGAFAVLALLLAGVGLYGILAFSVAQRTAEIGIRSALGARRKDVVALVGGEGVWVCATGLALGGAVSWVAAGAVEKLLFHTTAHSATPYLLSMGGLALVGVAAALVPVRRATRVDPAIALKSE
jgi:predicted permease